MMSSCSRGLAAALLATACGAATAADPAPGAAGLAQMLPGLGLVLVLILGLGWLAKRGGLARGVGNGPLKTVAERMVGTRERVVVVEVAGQWLVLGVAPGRVNALAQMPRPDAAIAGDDTSGATPAQPPFAAWLQRALKK
jgi:flagellar protein FliO/FliZ